MKKVFIYISAIVVVVVVLIVAFVMTLASPRYGIVKGKIYDELSGDAVRGVRLVLDERSTVIYQISRYELTKIPPAEHTLQVSSPAGWISFSKTFKVRAGENEVDIPLKGDKIPDLTGIICFTESEKEGITVEIRYVDSERIGMTEFPRLPIKINVTLRERVGREEPYEKGEKLFEGEVKDLWDSGEYLAKNKGFLPWDEVAVKFEDRKYAILDVKVTLEQGDFEDTIGDVKLFFE
ncbi:hypothetical protein IBX65_04105 [Candidatus Aerophobetes bacterium]|nr:hypothetical protein [Candidatus Aerophobetes bacterium]